MSKFIKTSLLLLACAAFVSAQSSHKKDKNNRKMNVKKHSVAENTVSAEEQKRIDLAIERSLNDQKALEEEQQNIDTAIARSLQDQKTKEAAEAKDRLRQALERAKDPKKKAESTLEQEFRKKKGEILPMNRQMEISTKEPPQEEKPTGKVSKVPFQTKADKEKTDSEINKYFRDPIRFKGQYGTVYFTAPTKFVEALKAKANKSEKENMLLEIINSNEDPALKIPHPRENAYKPEHYNAVLEKLLTYLPEFKEMKAFNMERSEKEKRSNSPDGGELADSAAASTPKDKSEEFDIIDPKKDLPASSTPASTGGSWWNPFNWFKK